MCSDEHPVFLYQSFLISLTHAVHGADKIDLETWDEIIFPKS